METRFNYAVRGRFTRKRFCVYQNSIFYDFISFQIISKIFEQMYRVFYGIVLVDADILKYEIVAETHVTLAFNVILKTR